MRGGDDDFEAPELVRLHVDGPIDADVRFDAFQKTKAPTIRFVQSIDFRVLLRESLHRDAVSDGQAALAAARAEHPDLVLADVMMPKLDGFGLVRELRADPALATIPILLVSARAGEEAIGDGLRRGADGYITKPFSASHLLVRIEAQLNTSRMKSAAYEERRRLYTALAAAPNPILLLTGPEHVVELVNPAGTEIAGFAIKVTYQQLRIQSM